MDGKCTVVIPTYNEEKNIVNMAKAIRQEYPDFRIMFMDDDSSDRSQELIEGLNDPLTKIVVRKNVEKGLLASVINGFQIAETEYAICMDCDFQHPVSVLKDIYSKLENGADLCVGKRNSRSNMGFVRTMGSHAVESFCKMDLRIHGVQTTKDMMSGLFGIRCDVFRDSITENWDKFEHRGWKILLDLMKFQDEKIKVDYVPYDFGERAAGESHLNPKIVVMTFHQLYGAGKLVAKLYCKKSKIDYYSLYPNEKK